MCALRPGGRGGQALGAGGDKTIARKRHGRRRDRLGFPVLETFTGFEGAAVGVQGAAVRGEGNAHGGAGVECADQGLPDGSGGVVDHQGDGGGGINIGDDFDFGFSQ